MSVVNYYYDYYKYAEKDHLELKTKELQNKIKYLPIVHFSTEICYTKLPKDIFKFKKLEKLSISSYSLKKFPKELYKLKKLKKIYIGNCQNLTSLGFQLEKFKNISIYFDENKYRRHEYFDNETSMHIIKKSDSLLLHYSTTIGEDTSDTFNGRTPVTYLRFINNIYTNLPSDLKTLTIEGIDTFDKKYICEAAYYSSIFEKLEYKINLTNLPPSLKEIRIVSTIKNIKEKINKYADIKLPYGCTLIFICKHWKNIQYHNTDDNDSSEDEDNFDNYDDEDDDEEDEEEDESSDDDGEDDESA
jgi:hypothetical protein